MASIEFRHRDCRAPGLKKSSGCNNKNGLFFLVPKQDFRGEHCFFDLSGSENFDTSEFHGGKICHVFVDVHFGEN